MGRRGFVNIVNISADLSTGLWRSFCVLILINFLSVALVNNSRADQAVHVLTATGTDLGIMFSSGTIEDLRFTVNLNGDQPTASFVWATVGSNDYRVRTNEGYWLPWNRQIDSLINNQFAIIDGKMVFKVLDQDIGIDNHGVSINIGYKVGEELKYGRFAIHPKKGGE